MSVSTGNATPPEFTKSRNPNSSVQIQTKAEFEFVPRDTERSNFARFGGFRGCSIVSGNCHRPILSLQHAETEQEGGGTKIMRDSDTASSLNKFEYNLFDDRGSSLSLVLSLFLSYADSDTAS